MTHFSPCIVIPCYNHGPTMPVTVAALAALGLPCIVVDDGSGAESAQILDRLAAEHAGLTLVRHAVNQGKGGAVMSGLREAARRGYSHALQIDADGQHATADAWRLLAEAQQHPETLVSGRPVYDASVPRARLYGRFFTHVWVWIETLSFSIKDSMCGFRVYPLAPVIALLDRIELGRRMDFDIEIMVRLHWDGVPMRFVDTRVSYPTDGLSHFDVWRDNLRISALHARLCLALLARLPGLLLRRVSSPHHWSATAERGSIAGIRLMLWIYRTFGRAAFNVLLYPVMTYFWLTGREARAASTTYLARVRARATHEGERAPRALNSYRHFVRFGQAMLDKLAGWAGDIRPEDIDFPAREQAAALITSRKGILLLGSHLGNLELCRALGEQIGGITINALVFTRHAERFNAVLQAANPRSHINLIQVNELGPETAILLQQKIEAGEWVVIVGDRTPIGPEKRVIWADFLGVPAPFPQGPFVLAALLGCPVYLMFGLRENGRFRVYLEPFADPLALPRKEREQALTAAVTRYAARLEHYCLKAPLDWFNFFDFWKLHDESARS